MSTIEKGKYTAGPWQWKNGKLLGDEGTPIRVDDPTSYSPYRIAQENGKLVSAAPELLEALVLLQEQVHVCRPTANLAQLRNVMNKVDDAIAKAEGRP